MKEEVLRRVIMRAQKRVEGVDGSEMAFVHASRHEAWRGEGEMPCWWCDYIREGVTRG